MWGIIPAAGSGTRIQPLAFSKELLPVGGRVDGAFERLSAIIADMRDAITRTRMQRIENLFVALPRMVRDLSAELGKQILVDIEGGDVELDREMIEMIRDPLTHIIRNAVDHGIELPADRLKSGKREIGLLCVSARQSGNQILIDIQDDGRGIDGTRLVVAVGEDHARPAPGDLDGCALPDAGASAGDDCDSHGLPACPFVEPLCAPRYLDPPIRSA